MYEMVNLVGRYKSVSGGQASAEDIHSITISGFLELVNFAEVQTGTNLDKGQRPFCMFKTGIYEAGGSSGRNAERNARDPQNLSLRTNKMDIK
jgi:hypothetical protein